MNLKSSFILALEIPKQVKNQFPRQMLKSNPNVLGFRRTEEVCIVAATATMFLFLWCFGLCSRRKLKVRITLYFFYDCSFGILGDKQCIQFTIDLIGVGAPQNLNTQIPPPISTPCQAIAVFKLLMYIRYCDRYRFDDDMERSFAPELYGQLNCEEFIHSV